MTRWSLDDLDDEARFVAELRSAPIDILEDLLLMDEVRDDTVLDDMVGVVPAPVYDPFLGEDDDET